MNRFFLTLIDDWRSNVWRLLKVFPRGRGRPRSISFIVAALFTCVAVSSQAQDFKPHFEIGGSLGEILRDDPRATSRNNTSFGPRFVYNMYAFGEGPEDLVLSLEGEMNWFIRDERSSFINGGHPTQGQFGAKAGYRGETWGIFFKTHPGFMSFGNVIRDFPAGTPARLGRLTAPILNLGGVLEFYPARHLTLRFDLGRTRVFYPHATIFGVNTQLAGKSFFQINTGLHFTF